MSLIHMLDWGTIAAYWLIFEQILSGSGLVQANSSIELVCNVVDSIVGFFKRRTN